MRKRMKKARDAALELRTDLALEVRESFPKDDIELSGVILSEQEREHTKIKISTVEIQSDEGAKRMGKPKGTYVTVDAEEYLEENQRERTVLVDEILNVCLKLCGDLQKKNVLIAGLGNRDMTADSIGPKVIEKLFVTRHLIREFGAAFQEKHKFGVVSAIAPGVMAQTGMESFEILSGILKEIGANQVILIDALAARNTKRLNTTIQLTDTGICPGAGVGNHRKAMNQETLGVPILAIGVPTVVDAATIVQDTMEDILAGQGCSQEELEKFSMEIRQKAARGLFVTPKNIDESVDRMSSILADALNQCFVPQR